VAGELASLLGAPPPPSGASILARAAWLIGLLGAALDDASRRHPHWTVVSHEWLCEQTPERFAGLAERVGLGWSERSDRLLARLDRPGSGYATTRVATTLPEAWRERLAPEQVEEASAVLDGFAVATPSRPDPGRA